MEDAEAAAGFALGSPDYYSYMAGQLKTFFDRAYAIRGGLTGRPCVCFLSHGGGGHAIESIEDLVSSINMTKVAESVSVKGAPDGEDETRCIELGRTLALATKKKTG